MDRVLKTCLSPALDDNYLLKNNASTQVLYLNKRILSDFFQNENCCNKSTVKDDKVPIVNAYWLNYYAIWWHV